MTNGNPSDEAVTPTGEEASDSNDKATGRESKEPSLGPACLVVSILMLAAFSSICAFGSWIVFSDQYPLATKAITKQLIPWVESSQLADSDKQSILRQLRDLLPRLEAREIDKEQLLRLRNCLQDNPVLLWGGIQSMRAQAEKLDMSDTERQALERIDERLLKMSADRMLGRSNLEFTLQGVSKVREDGLSIEVRSDLTADEIREFMKRAENLLESNGVPNQPYEKTPAEAFEILIEGALNPPPPAG